MPLCHYLGLLRYVTCDGDDPVEAAHVVEREIQQLMGDDVPPLSSALVICPLVEEWGGFDTFDAFVRFGIKEHLVDTAILDHLTSVSFRPDFTRWHGLPPDIKLESIVLSHWGMIGQNSQQMDAATITDTETKAFGLRKVKLRFHAAFCVNILD